MKSRKDKQKVFQMEQNNHLQGIQAGNAIHESAMYPGSVQECSHQTEQCDYSCLYSALNRPHLNHCLQFCSLLSHWKATKIAGEHVTYEERLRDPNLHGDEALEGPHGSLLISKQRLWRKWSQTYHRDAWQGLGRQWPYNETGKVCFVPGGAGLQ